MKIDTTQFAESNPERYFKVYFSIEDIPGYPVRFFPGPLVKTTGTSSDALKKSEVIEFCKDICNKINNGEIDVLQFVSYTDKCSIDYDNHVIESGDIIIGHFAALYTVTNKNGFIYMNIYHAAPNEIGKWDIYCFYGTRCKQYVGTVPDIDDINIILDIMIKDFENDE